MVQRGYLKDHRSPGTGNITPADTVQRRSGSQLLVKLLGNRWKGHNEEKQGPNGT